MTLYEQNQETLAQLKQTLGRQGYSEKLIKQVDTFVEKASESAGSDNLKRLILPVLESFTKLDRPTSFSEAKFSAVLRLTSEVLPDGGSRLKDWVVLNAANVMGGAFQLAAHNDNKAITDAEYCAMLWQAKVAGRDRKEGVYGQQESETLGALDSAREAIKAPYKGQPMPTSISKLLSQMALRDQDPSFESGEDFEDAGAAMFVLDKEYKELEYSSNKDSKNLAKQINAVMAASGVNREKTLYAVSCLLAANKVENLGLSSPQLLAIFEGVQEDAKTQNRPVYQVLNEVRNILRHPEYFRGPAASELFNIAREQ